MEEEKIPHGGYRDQSLSSGQCWGMSFSLPGLGHLHRNKEKRPDYEAAWTVAWRAWGQKALGNPGQSLTVTSQNC